MTQTPVPTEAFAAATQATERATQQAREFGEQAVAAGRGYAELALNTYDLAGCSSSTDAACSYSASADVRNDRASASRTWSDGARRPRSICDRYGLEIPTMAASWRIGRAASSRCWRMMSPNVGGVRSRSL